MGRPRDARVLQHHAAAREDLRERGRGADAVLRIRRGLRRRRTRTAAASTRAEGRDAAEGLSVGAIRPVAARRRAALVVARRRLAEVAARRHAAAVVSQPLTTIQEWCRRERGVPRTCCRRTPDGSWYRGIVEAALRQSARDVQLQGRRRASRLGYHHVHAPARDPTVASASRRLDRVSRGPKPRLNTRR